MYLSGLILVKDNARTIHYALESIKKHTDEIVIIDSGSTDATLDIARKYTDRIFFRKWDNNFGEQRNFGLAKCRGKWILVLDSDEFIGENFVQVLPFLTKKYRVIALPRYHLVDVPSMTYITSKPHHLDWQSRLILNDGTSRYNKAIHETLTNYRPRLRCNLANIFHLDFAVNDHAARQKKVNHYIRQYPGTGYPRMYLFENYPYKTARTLENPEPAVVEMLEQDKFFSYPRQSDITSQIKQQINFQIRSLLTRTRASLGI